MTCLLIHLTFVYLGECEKTTQRCSVMHCVPSRQSSDKADKEQLGLSSGMLGRVQSMQQA